MPPCTPPDEAAFRAALRSALEERDAAAKLRRLRRKAVAERLYALPDHKAKLASTARKLQRLQENGLSMRSDAIARFQRSGVRLPPEQIYAALVQDANAKIAALQFEIDTIEEALDSLRNDPYFAVIEEKYFQHLSDGLTAKALGVDGSTIRKQRIRLLNQLALRLDE